MPARRSSGARARDRPDEVLARDGQQDRPAERVQRWERAEHLDALLRVFAKSGPGSSSSCSAATPRRSASATALAQEREDVLDPVLVAREVDLLGLGARVHDDQRAAAARRDVREPGVPQAADVIEDRGAGLDRRSRDGGLPGVDGHEHAFGDEPLDERDDALDLDLLRGDPGVGDARLAADVDQVRALGDEVQRVPGLGLERVERGRCPRTSRGSR